MTDQSADPVDKPRSRRVRSSVHDQIPKRDAEKGETKLSNDKIAAILELVATNPDDVVRRLAKAEGFPYHATEKFLKRLRVTHSNFKEAVQRLGRRELIEKIQDKIALGLHYMDDFSFAGMDAKDIAITLGILIEKEQLLQGRPTMILSFEERRHLSDLLPAYVAEARRRGITIDQTAVEVTTEIVPRTFLPDETQEEALSHTARSELVRRMPTEDR